MDRKFWFWLFFRLLWIFGWMLLVVFLLNNKFLFTGFFGIIIIIVSIIEFYYFFKKPFREIHKVLSALVHDDYSLKVNINQHSTLFSDLEKLYHKQKDQYFDQQSVKLIYDNLLNSISSGILILRKTESEDWEIFLMNRTLADIFQIPIYSSWNNLQRNLSEFTDKLKSINFEEINETLEISIDNSENQTYSLKTSAIKTYTYQYYTATLDSVQTIIEKKEKQAWYDLMQVISHEMMNTLTPINSLINSMEYYTEQPQLSAEDNDDFKESLKTIQKKTVHILEFVENYRKISQLPQPKKKNTDLVKLVGTCVEMMHSVFEEKEILVGIISDYEELNSLIDPVLIERVIINLLTNSIYSLESRENDRQIKIKIQKTSERIFVGIWDNGSGIEKEIRDKVFIPFFTTRTNGAGIGLSLSKNIMEAHDGNLTFKSKPGDTGFLMSFYI
ncbi:MAG: ATP-binding protein [Weeksellaceae bacterium]|jgi:nitrogen fixation/metabolism regulation signal transduction histidine kinase|nr:ATP-binding protein [Weeksellaceae bacterium]